MEQFGPRRLSRVIWQSGKHESVQGKGLLATEQPKEISASVFSGSWKQDAFTLILVAILQPAGAVLSVLDKAISLRVFAPWILCDSKSHFNR